VEAALPRKRRTAAVGASVLDLDAAGFYKPLTRQTRDAYEALLDTIQVRARQAIRQLARCSISTHILPAIAIRTYPKSRGARVENMHETGLSVF